MDDSVHKSKIGSGTQYRTTSNTSDFHIIEEPEDKFEFDVMFPRSENQIQHLSSPMDRSFGSSVHPEEAGKLLGCRLNSLNDIWWRCSRCLQRIKVSNDGCMCTQCNVSCEPERIAWRNKALISKNSGLDGGTTERLSAAEKTSLMVQGMVWQRYGSSHRLEDQGEREINAVGLTPSDCRCFFWYKTYSPLSLIAGLLMVGLFIWVNQRMELEVSSNFVQRIVAASVRAIPVQVAKTSHLVPFDFILVSYLLTSAIWSISTVGWKITRLQSPWVGYGYLYILLGTAFWSLQGLTPAELFLAFLPLSVSIGICLYTICSGPVIDPPTCKRCATGQDRHEWLTSTALLPIRHPYFGKPPLDVSHKDLEMNVKE